MYSHTDAGIEFTEYKYNTGEIQIYKFLKNTIQPVEAWKHKNEARARA